MSPAAGIRSGLIRKATVLSFFTIGYNTIEGIVSMALKASARSAGSGM